MSCQGKEHLPLEEAQWTQRTVLFLGGKVMVSKLSTEWFHLRPLAIIPHFEVLQQACFSWSYLMPTIQSLDKHYVSKL